MTWSAAQWQQYESRGVQLDQYAVFENTDQTVAWYGFGAVATYTLAHRRLLQRWRHG